MNLFFMLVDGGMGEIENVANIAIKSKTLEVKTGSGTKHAIERGEVKRLELRKERSDMDNWGFSEGV